MTARWSLALLLSAFLALALLLGGCQRPGERLPARPVSPPGSRTSTTSVETLQSGGVARTYRLHLPPGAQGGQPLPLVLSLHGLNGEAAQQEQVSQFSTLADAQGFVVAYPQGQGTPAHWAFRDRPEGQADLAFIRAVVAQVQQRLPIDPQRIYVAGISNGAELSEQLACQMAETFAAIALVSGGYPPQPNCQPARPVPVVLFHGTKDQVLPYEGRPPLLQPVREWAAGWATRNSCAAQPQVSFEHGKVRGETWSGCQANAEVTLYTITGKGHSWPGSIMPAAITTHDIDATAVIWAFFVAHPKP